MASSSSSSPRNFTFPPPFPTGLDPNNSVPNTTFVQADPSTFRAVVQKLTGAEQQNQIPAAVPSKLAGKTISGEMGPRRPAFKLHERRQTARKLEIKLNSNYTSLPSSMVYNNSSSSPSSSLTRVSFLKGEVFMVSPVSPLERLSPRSPAEEEERAIAEKGFYLHKSPLSTPRGADPPELLPLFPLQSPRQNENDDNSKKV